MADPEFEANLVSFWPARTTYLDPDSKLSVSTVLARYFDEEGREPALTIL